MFGDSRKGNYEKCFFFQSTTSLVGKKACVVMSYELSRNSFMCKIYQRGKMVRDMPEFC